MNPDEEWLDWGNAVFCSGHRDGKSGPENGFINALHLRQWLAEAMDRRSRHQVWLGSNDQPSRFSPKIDIAPARHGHLSPAVKHLPVVVWVDGACEPNPGIGGFAARIECGDEVIEDTGVENESTSSRAELLAVILGLEMVPHGAVSIEVKSDSKYAVNGSAKWAPTWARTGWITKSTKQPVANIDLWKNILDVIQWHRTAGTHVKFEHVPGHCGIPGNERVDDLAVTAIAEHVIMQNMPAAQHVNTDFPRLVKKEGAC